MTLSHREQEILDEIADGLAEQDPALVAELSRPRPRLRSRLPYGSAYGRWACSSWPWSC